MSAEDSSDISAEACRLRIFRYSAVNNDELKAVQALGEDIGPRNALRCGTTRVTSRDLRLAWLSSLFLCI